MYKPRILVVEDNLMLQKLVSLLAKKNNLEADIVGTCQEALARCKSGTDYDIIFMDWSLPDTNGLDCTKQIRKLGGRHIPIVAMTANAMYGDREECLSAGMDDYLGKPFTSDEFAQAVQRWLQLPVERSLNSIEPAFIQADQDSRQQPPKAG